MADSKTQGLDAWVTRLSKAELPVLAGVMRDINRLTKDSDTSVNQLSEVILKDAGLTAKVLRLANSVYFNPQHDQEVTTISRAVVKLGFKGIKAICLSVMLIDSLLKKGNKQRMLEWMARGFHAAVQAEQLVAGRDKQLKEDVFIAALLMHLGDMAFWSCRATGEMTELEQRLASRKSNADVERAVLGTTLHEITQELAELWELGDTLKEALGNGEPDSLAARAVRLGEEISAASEQGWDSDALETALDKVAAFSGQTREEARQMLFKGAEEAAGVALSYGANKVCNYIPSTSDAPSAVHSTSKANPQLQLSILRELAAMINENVDVNTMFQMVVEGVHRGVGLERVALCLIDPKKKLLQAKYALGEDSVTWRENLRFSIKSEQDNLLAHSLFSRQLLWMRADKIAPLRYLIDNKTSNVLDVDNCLLAPLYAGARQVGILIADRGPDGDAIEQDQYESFCHFAQQANMGLAMLANKGK